MNLLNMDRRQRKRLLIFMVIPLLLIILFITEDFTIRVITVVLLLIYIFLIIFLRDTLRFKGFGAGDYEDNLAEETPGEEPQEHFDESFEIVSKNKNVEVITSENYVPEFRAPKTTLKPPDLKERFEEIAQESVPSEIGHDGQFTFVLERMLTIIREAYAANTAIFFWYNKKKDKLSVEKYVSGSPDQIAQRKFDIEDDILSKIVQSGEPELLSDISPAAEADVIRYYSSVQGIRSFVGVPLFYDKQLIAIIAVDAKAGDAFGIETIYSLGRFVRVITMIITIFEEKHSDTLSQQRLNGLLNIVPDDMKFDKPDSLPASFQDSINKLISWDAFAFIYYNPVAEKFSISKVVNNTSLKYAGENLDIEISGTLTGKSIVTGMPVKIDDTSQEKYIRFSKIEDVSFDGSFLAIPLVYNGQNFGVLCFESLKKNAYTNNDVQFIKSATNIFSFIVYSYSTHSLLKSYLAVDIETKALNDITFRERLANDLAKAELFNAPGALALIRIDEFIEQESLFDGDPFPKVLEAVSDIISKEMTHLNLFGRLDDKTFGVYFFNESAKNVFIWAEKLRVKIARQPVAVVSKQTTYTVSIGVAAATGKSPSEVITNAELALNKALEKGGNTVRNLN